MDNKNHSELPPIPSEQQLQQQVQGIEQMPMGAVSERKSTIATEGAPQGVVPQYAVPQQPAVAPPQQMQPVADPAGMPAIADDNDLIEKEWVQKAKAIIAQTKLDPYEQNKQVERMKADYMKKRYGKDIKVTED